MNSKVAKPVFECLPSEVVNVIVDIRDMLRKDANDALAELATGTPTLTDPTGVVTASPSVNTGTEIIRKQSVVAGGAIKFKATIDTNASTGIVYVMVTFTTDATPAPTRKFRVPFKILN